MLSVLTNKKLTSTQSVDIIENTVYEHLKPMGFKKYGRTLHRFTDGDISQVINFQNGCPQKGVLNILIINIGIRVPECVERSFTVSSPMKKYYHEYDCNMRTQLDRLTGEKCYSLKKNPQKIADDIIDKLEKYVIPVFDVLNCRRAIIEHRSEYKNFDLLSRHMILLEEAMIFGRNGDTQKAAELFREHYKKTLDEFLQESKNGTQTYLHKGEKIIYRNAKTDKTETITAEKDGYVTLYRANRGHLEYLEKLAKELNITL